MFKRFLIIFFVCSLASAVNCQFWNGFLYGLMQGMQNLNNQLQQQPQQNQFQQPTQQIQQSTQQTPSISTSSNSETTYQKETLEIEDDGYKWIEVSSGSFYGAKSETGNWILPLSLKLKFCYYYDGEFHVKDENWSCGIYSIQGKCIIPPSRGYDSISKLDEDKDYYYSIKKNGKEGACNKNGKEIIPPEYENLLYLQGGYHYTTDSKYNNDFRNWIGLNIDINGNMLRNSEPYHGNTNSGSTYPSVSKDIKFPITMAYCTSDKMKNVKTNEERYNQPTFGYIRIQDDKVIFDNIDTFIFYSKDENNTRAYSKSGNINGLSVKQIVFVDENLANVKLFMTTSDLMLEAKIYLMDIESFERLKQQYSTTQYQTLFQENSLESNSVTSNSATTSSHGNKTCYICHGTGNCQACGGSGILRGLGTESTCRQCWSGRQGKCSTCQGTGQVYGLR